MGKYELRYSQMSSAEDHSSKAGMDEDATQLATQQVLDPRRLGRDESGMTADDHADIICILHPCSPASYRVVQQTARLAPHHVLQSHSVSRDDPSQPLVPLPGTGAEEAETFVLDKPGGAGDLALRMSSRLSKPYLGFLFGRSPTLCDIPFSTRQDTAKRLSNTHFRIYLNDDGIVMLEDMSTNGTMVDTYHLRSKGLRPDVPATRMLNHLSSIDIPSPKEEESIKFIVRIPSRSGYEDEYMSRLNEWLMNYNLARQHVLGTAGTANYRQTAAPRVVRGAPAATGIVGRRPLLGGPLQYGMHWDGGADYNVISRLGQGAFATVYKLATAMDGKLLAAKELEKKRFVKNGHMDQRLDNEMKIMRSLRHPNIVQYIDYRDQGKYLYIIMEFVPHGDLQGYLNDYSILPEEPARHMACQILNSLAYLHSRKVTHRDIKPDNILIASLNPFTVKLSDFGLSKVVSDAETFLKTFCGTLLYCAPEVFPQYDQYAGKGTKRRRQPTGLKKTFHSYSQSVDIWSFAAVLWFSLCGKPPFEGVSDSSGRGMFEKIMSTRLNTAPLRERNVSPAAIDLLVKMLNIDPSQRPTEQECLAHPWLAGLQQGRVPQRPQEDDLKVIPEEDENGVTEQKLSQLSIHVNSNEDDRAFDAACEEEPDEFDFINPRQVKRVRHDVLVPRHQPRNGARLASSPDIPHCLRQPGQKNDEGFVLPQAPASKAKQRLFGEIRQSALNSSGLPEEHASQRHSKNGNLHGTSAQKVPFGTPTKLRANQVDIHSARSLMGAAAMIEELNMDSSQSPGSTSENADEPHTPRTPDRSHEHHNLPETPLASLTRAGAEKGGSYLSEKSQELTPKAPVPFSRRINIPKTASYYWDPHDRSTHNLEYSSRVSGYDFVGEAAAASARAGLQSMPATVAGSARPSHCSMPATEAGPARSRQESMPATVAGSAMSRQESMPATVAGSARSRQESMPATVAGSAMSRQESMPATVAGSARSRQESMPATVAGSARPGFASMPATEAGSTISGLESDSEGSVNHDDKTASTASSQNFSHSEEAEEVPGLSTPSGPLDVVFLRPAPRLGTLTSTKDSFATIVLRLENRFTSWGRLSGNTIIYPNKLDTRIPKEAFLIWFHAPGIVQAEKEGRDWTRLENLRTFISTRARNGIYVNGKKLLPKSRAGVPLFGCLNTGDVITAFAGGRDASGMKFTCELFFGEGQKMRDTKTTGRFKIWEDVRSG